MTYHADLYWTSADMQSDMDMSGDYSTDDRSVAAAHAVREMLSQTGEPEQRATVLAGSIDGVSAESIAIDHGII
jgi:hypothetical protein